jgi:hypothetical protein
MSNNNQKQENIPNISLDEIDIRWKPEDCAFFGAGDGLVKLAKKIFSSLFDSIGEYKFCDYGTRNDVWF